MFFMFLLFPTVLSIMFLFFLLLLLLSMSLFTAVTITTMMTMMSASALMSAPASFLSRVLFLVLCRLSVPIKMEIMKQILTSFGSSAAFSSCSYNSFGYKKIGDIEGCKDRGNFVVGKQNY